MRFCSESRDPQSEYIQCSFDAAASPNRTVSKPLMPVNDVVKKTTFLDSPDSDRTAGTPMLPSGMPVRPRRTQPLTSQHNPSRTALIDVRVPILSSAFLKDICPRRIRAGRSADYRHPPQSAEFVHSPTMYFQSKHQASHINGVYMTPRTPA